MGCVFPECEPPGLAYKGAVMSPFVSCSGKKLVWL